MPRDNYTRYPRAILWLIREGRVTIGGPDPDSQPAFEARLGSFYMSKAPITNRQFEAFDANFDRSRICSGDDDSATGISFRQARAYCDWYAGVSRKPIRLPTEVEWEYACRAGATGQWFFGERAEEGEAHVWDAGNCAETLPHVARLKPNGFGLLGMLGSVWEWTASRHLSYPLDTSEADEDRSTDSKRVLRGGSFRLPRHELHCGRRRAELPDFADEDVGFRIVRSF
jgi:formylglycine-generating enzyme required for sulfatase activity